MPSDKYCLIIKQKYKQECTNAEPSTYCFMLKHMFMKCFNESTQGLLLYTAP